jgi:aquaporin Z
MAPPSASLVAKCSAEFVGTFLLVFTVGCNVLGKTAVWTGVSIACVLMVVIYAFGGISGGHFNPAVSVAIGLASHMGSTVADMEWQQVGIYCIVQIVGGITAGMCYLALFGFSFSLGPSRGFGAMEAGMCEVLYTFMLCFVVLNVACSKANAGKNQYYGLAIGFVVVAGAYGAGTVSGGCFNPAVAFGIDVANAMHGFGWSFAYLAFELIGAALAAVLFKVVRPGDFGEGEEKPLAARLTSEFLGTFMLVLTVGLNVLGKSPAGAFSIAAALMSMIYALGDVSGAHFNPAVTLAILCAQGDEGFGGNKLELKDAGFYVLVQVVGGIFASLTYALIHGGATFPLGPGHGFQWAQVGIAETVFTFVLCLVVLCVACSEKKSTEMFGLAIGSCVTVGGFAIGNISGGSLNPAVSVGIAAAQIINGGAFYKCLIYTIFELLGGAAAACVYKVTHESPEKGEAETA